MNPVDSRPLLIVVTGPTGSGKSALALKIAQHLGCDIISADSRQIYRGIPIGTAAPSAEDKVAVPHHFVEILDLEQYYSAAKFEEDVLALLPVLWKKNPVQVMCGGSMMYVDAVTDGIDLLPTISPEIRNYATNLLSSGGIEAVRAELSRLDPLYLSTADRCNHKRLVHAVEVCLQAGVPYSSLRTGKVKDRPFRVMKVAIDHDRDTLFTRINRRVDQMVSDGLESEALRVYPKRHLNALNTVGFKEMFAMFDGVMDRTTAIARMAKNTRVYAKKQLTWMKRRDDFGQVVMLNSDDPFTHFCKLYSQIQ